MRPCGREDGKRGACLTADEKRPVVRISVRGVVETTLHEHDLNPAAGQAMRMREGVAAHTARQAAAGAADSSWRSEVSLSADYEADGFTLRVTGRADGLMAQADGTPVIEEIKLGGPGEPLQEAHLAQAQMYGHMLARAEGYGRVRLRVLYADAQGTPQAVYEQTYSVETLAGRFGELCMPVAALVGARLQRQDRRDSSLEALAFPYPAWRSGQRAFSAGIWRAIRERGRLFAQAPTGIGKTIGALWPALHALPRGYAARVLFLTARNTGRAAAMDALTRMEAAGAWLTACEIVAKDKACPMDRRDCRPEACPYAEGYYDRLPGAMAEALSPARVTGVLTAGRLHELAERYRLCPFELSLAAAQEADCVVCDYNYVYDPFVSIDALLHGPGGAVLLVDEAHQLAPRVRDAYSAELDSGAIRTLRRECGLQEGRKSPLYRALTAVLRALEAEQEAAGFSEEGYRPGDGLCDAAETLTREAAQALSEGAGRPAADAFALGRAWMLAAERLDGRWAVFAGGGAKSAYVRLCLLDVAQETLALSQKAHGTAYFSATFSPQEAMRRILGGTQEDILLQLPSPFDPEQLSVRVAPIDVRYAAREATAGQVASEVVNHLLEGRENAMAFFPSYAYLQRVAPLIEDGLAGRMAVLQERRGMTEAEKKSMLLALVQGANPGTALLCVLGGAFSEAVDLPGDRLGCAVVVTTGMPQPDERIEALRRSYDAQGEDGWFLTMTLPGMIRVIQAAGRLIRTPEDRGRLLLIDSRYTQPRIRALLRGTLIGMVLDSRKMGE